MPPPVPAELSGPHETYPRLQEIPEGLHPFSRCKCIGDLIDEAEPASNVCDVLWRGEVLDGFDELRARADSGRGNVKAGKLHSCLSKGEFGRVEGHPIVAT